MPQDQWPKNDLSKLPVAEKKVIIKDPIGYNSSFYQGWMNQVLTQGQAFTAAIFDDGPEDDIINVPWSAVGISDMFEPALVPTQSLEASAVSCSCGCGLRFTKAPWTDEEVLLT